MLKSVGVSTGPAQALYVWTLNYWILGIMLSLDFSLI